MGDILERLAKPPIQEPEMNHESDDAWLARQVEGMDRAEIANLAKAFAWKSYWLSESLDCSWVLPNEIVEQHPLSAKDYEWPEPPKSPYESN